MLLLGVPDVPGGDGGEAGQGGQPAEELLAAVLSVESKRVLERISIHGPSSQALVILATDTKSEKLLLPFSMMIIAASPPGSGAMSEYPA